MIATLVAFGARVDRTRWRCALAWGSVAGSALQFLVQLPVRAAAGAGAAAAARSRARRTCATVLRNFVPVFVSRGVVQISAYVDALLASLLPTGAVAGAVQRADCSTRCR